MQINSITSPSFKGIYVSKGVSTKNGETVARYEYRPFENETKKEIEEALQYDGKMLHNAPSGYVPSWLASYASSYSRRLDIKLGDRLNIKESEYCGAQTDLLETNDYSSNNYIE